MKDRELRKFHILLPVGIGLLIVSILAGGTLLTWQGAQARNLTDSWLNGVGSQTDRLLTAWLDSGWKALEQGGEPVREDEEGKLCTEDGMVYQLVPDAMIPSQRSLMPCLGPDQEPCLALLEWEAGEMRGVFLPLEQFRKDWLSLGQSTAVLLADQKGTVLISLEEGGTVMQLLPQEENPILTQAARKMTGEEPGGSSLRTQLGLQRLWVIPAGASGNGWLSVGLLAVIPTAGKYAALGWILWGMLAGVGLILTIAMLRHRQEQAQTLRHLKLLEQKTAAMEEWNQKLQQLTHHQRLEIMGTLTSGIAHEFNNLLVPIMGYSMMALEKLSPNQEVYDDVLEIYDASRKAGTLVQRLSDLTRKNAPTAQSLLSPGELVEKTLKVAKPAQPENVKVLTRHQAPESRIRGNEVQLSQMLLNLILNAFHAMPEGGTVTVKTGCREGKIYFSVSDTGTGIAPEAISHIFEPFFSTKDPGKGTGLGLAIVSQVVHEHGGEIDVQSRLGVGTVFLVTFPRPEEREPS